MTHKLCEGGFLPLLVAQEHVEYQFVPTQQLVFDISKFRGAKMNSDRDHIAL